MSFIKEQMRSGLFKKYMISYFLIFLIPFMLMSYFLYKSSITDLRDTIEDTNLTKLEQATNYTNERMQELDQLTTRITYDSRLSPYEANHDYYSRSVISELKNYKENSAIVEDVFLYYQDGDRVYSSSGAHNISTMMNDIPPFNQWSQKSFSDRLNAEKPEVISPKMDSTKQVGSNMMVSLHPIPNNNPQPFGTVMYTIKESVLTKQIDDILGDYQGNTYILDQDDDMVAASENDSDIDESILQNVKKYNAGNHRMNYDKQDYSMSVVKSDVNDWTFISFMNAKQIDNLLYYRKLFSIMLISLLLLAGVVLAVVLANRQYKPIRHLYEKTRDKNNKSSISKGNELDTINNAISDIVESHEKLSNRVLIQNPFARDQLIINLLKGTLHNRDDLEVLLKSLNINMKDGSYFVAVLYFESLQDSEEDMHRRENVVHQLSNEHHAQVALYAVDLLYNDAIALIISTNDNISHITEERRRIVYEVQQQVKEMTKSKPVIGVGRPCEDKRNINRSYIEALATVDHRFALQQGSIIYFEDLTTIQSEEIGYPEENQLKLIYSIKQGDQIVCREVLKDIFIDITSRQGSGYQIKAICFDIINTVIKTASELGLTEQIENIDELVDFQNLEQLEQSLQKTVIHLCEKIERKTESYNEQLRRNIIEYIHSNYKNYDLSLESMARHFNLSVPYLSRFVKEQVGETFTHYVFELRLRDVKYELTHSDKLIKDIIVGVGYTDVSNFSREFKKAEKITPGQYRKLNRS